MTQSSFCVWNDTPNIDTTVTIGALCAESCCLEIRVPLRRNIDIDLLRTFVSIVETGSFTRTAERMLRTQSAVSLQVKRLEDALGISLFERGSKPVRVAAKRVQRGGPDKGCAPEACARAPSAGR